jgi:TatD DNase family protein
MSNQILVPTLDAHAHIKHSEGTDLTSAGAVLAMTLSLEEASQAVRRKDPLVLWGVGSHPNEVKAQEDFDVHTFVELVKLTPVVGEIGLDKRSPVPLEVQLKVFRSILEVVADYPRVVSIHSNHTTNEVLEELTRKPITYPVLHWWNGSDSRTKAAVEVGSYFSIHSAIASYSRSPKFVPLERILLETDRGYDVSPSLIPSRIAAVESVVSTKYQTESGILRKTVWKNFGRLIENTRTRSLLSEPLMMLIERSE